jgi:hypothetical protein
VGCIPEAVDHKEIKLFVLRPDGIAYPGNLNPYNGNNGYDHQNYQTGEFPHVHGAKLYI